MKNKPRRIWKKQDVSIYTLAEEMGVTPGTVSRALRNRPEIGVATRKAIRQRAAELGFKLRTFETRITNICAVIETLPNQPSLFSAYVDAVLDGIWRYCGENDIELSLFGEDLERLSKCDLVRVLGRRGVNGAVFLNASKQSRYFPSLNEQNFPYCCVMTGPPQASGWTIRADAAGMAERATEHLIHLRHRRIALLDSLLGYEQGEERKIGYLRALEKAGLGRDAAIIFTSKDCGSTPADGFDFAVQGVRALLGRPRPPTAFLTMSDEAGLAALHELSACGMKVPGQVSVISFDDSRFCMFSNPPLTVLSLPYEKIGTEAASIVHRRLEENASVNPHLPIIVSGDLVVRGSSGPAPGG